MSDAGGDGDDRSPEERKADEEFYATHGYPAHVDLAWLEDRLAAMSRMLMKLSLMQAPETIMEKQRRLVAQREEWIAAWKRDHPEATT